jgi:hypothetical protein
LIYLLFGVKFHDNGIVGIERILMIFLLANYVCNFAAGCDFLETFSWRRGILATVDCFDLADPTKDIEIHLELNMRIYD